MTSHYTISDFDDRFIKLDDLKSKLDEVYFEILDSKDMTDKLDASYLVSVMEKHVMHIHTYMLLIVMCRIVKNVYLQIRIRIRILVDLETIVDTRLAATTCKTYFDLHCASLFFILFIGQCDDTRQHR